MSCRLMDRFSFDVMFSLRGPDTESLYEYLSHHQAF